jgi:hypothetical protein
MNEWCVVCDKRIIVSGPHAISEEDARERAARWNTLYVGANYEAINRDEVAKRRARFITWDDVGGQEHRKERKEK